MFRVAIFVSAILSMYAAEAVSKSADSIEAQQIAKFADKVCDRAPNYSCD